MNPLTRHHPRAFSLVECAIAVVLVGGLYVATLQLVGSSRLTQFRFADRERGALLAQTLMAEITALPYDDPQAGGATRGLDSGETAGQRSGYDDVDDYHNLVESPPAERGGVAIPGAARFTRRVSVEWVQTANLRTTAGSNQGVKRITVTVTTGNKAVAELVTFRTRTWPSAGQMLEVVR